MTAMPGFAPLKGVLVVALEQAVSAPLGTRTLADLGARVIKVENSAGGDFTRSFDDVVNGMAALVSNLRPGATGRLGISPDDLARRYPRLIGVEISGYGRGGPLSANPATITR